MDCDNVAKEKERKMSKKLNSDREFSRKGNEKSNSIGNSAAKKKQYSYGIV